MSNQKKYRANPVVSCGEEKDGAVLFNPDINDTVVVNLSGRMLWHYLEQPHTVEELSQFLKEKYPGVSLKQAADDADRFVRDLIPDFLLEDDGHA